MPHVPLLRVSEPLPSGVVFMRDCIATLATGEYTPREFVRAPARSGRRNRKNVSKLKIDLTPQNFGRELGLQTSFADKEPVHSSGT